MWGAWAFRRVYQTNRSKKASYPKIRKFPKGGGSWRPDTREPCPTFPGSRKKPGAHRQWWWVKSLPTSVRRSDGGSPRLPGTRHQPQHLPKILSLRRHFSPRREKTPLAGAGAELTATAPLSWRACRAAENFHLAPQAAGPQRQLLGRFGRMFLPSRHRRKQSVKLGFPSKWKESL